MHQDQNLSDMMSFCKQTSPHNATAYVVIYKKTSRNQHLDPKNRGISSFCLHHSHISSIQGKPLVVMPEPMQDWKKLEHCKYGDEAESMMEEAEDFLPKQVSHKTYCSIETSPRGFSWL